MKARRPLLALAGGLGLALAACQQPAFAAEEFVHAPAAKAEAHESGGLKTAIFAGGCFWGIEAVFSHVKGVKSAVSGYHGGTEKTANYATVSTGRTGHAEAVKITYDPKVVRYDQLMRIFFSVGADPTQKNRQGPDVGTQYRTAIVPLSAEQNRVAKAYLAQMKGGNSWGRPIVATIERGQAFYPADAHHQDFAAKNPNHPYIRRWDAPKVAALSKYYPQFYSRSFQRN
ncbi:peptide-methionine (S)-S-oxide reductase MsrA [Erythrobacter sp. LQ02-29]|uniref:peptide-methionine (S)-S-oxide reductase MsrA n=1 Tax=Erythrobacter sp. LQ02-29 TaxID=2920384 RepID=UPI001F4D7965|nr:peptide-methionine (S)-S-oxide reductase MsrA [Erythrobacter sp. LQ02-29]MCP9221937.1 peptide-methionine (S)-S-oxide reductase MsrA [Erythrobacter sp. LQ02-29]